MAIDTAFRSTGPRRVCQVCRVNRGTDHGRFTVHFDAGTGKVCPGSDQRVTKCDPDLRITRNQK